MACYREACHQYRSDDEIEVTTENHQRLAAILRDLSSSFGRRISVLDAGCGSGRYFHCVENADLLVGLDLSPEMLEAARTPVRSEFISANRIQLVCDNLYRVQFPAGAFDLIYSLGVFGHGCPLTRAMCDRFRVWLVPDGKLFLNVIYQSRPRCYVAAKIMLRDWMGPGFRTQKDGQGQRALPFFALRQRELRRILMASRFYQFEIHKQTCRSPLWSGAHLECLACKAPFRTGA